jgi:hypothetical protein
LRPLPRALSSVWMRILKAGSSVSSDSHRRSASEASIRWCGCLHGLGFARGRKPSARRLSRRSSRFTKCPDLVARYQA